MAYIRELTEDKVVATAELGAKSNGKRVTKTKTFHRTKNVSKSRWKKSYHLTTVNEWEKDLKSGSFQADDIKLDAFVVLWEKERACVHLRKNTLDGYKDQLNRIILPTLGHVRLSEISSLMIQKIINSLADDGKSRRTVKYPLQVLSSVLSQAIKWGYLKENPCSMVEIPPIPKKEKRKHYEKEEVKKWFT